MSKNVLLEYAPMNYQCFFILAIYGGFRLGEIMGLTWKDVDFQNNVIHISIPNSQKMSTMQPLIPVLLYLPFSGSHGKL